MKTAAKYSHLVSPDSVAVDVKLSDSDHQPSDVTKIYDPPESGCSLNLEYNFLLNRKSLYYNMFEVVISMTLLINKIKMSGRLGQFAS